jgi:hypothetical protein
MQLERPFSLIIISSFRGLNYNLTRESQTRLIAGAFPCMLKFKKFVAEQ